MERPRVDLDRILGREGWSGRAIAANQSGFSSPLILRRFPLHSHFSPRSDRLGHVSKQVHIGGRKHMSDEGQRIQPKDESSELNGRSVSRREFLKIAGIAGA